MTQEYWSRDMVRVDATRLMGEADPSPSVLFGETEMDLWPYRRRTIALLRRYGRASVEVGRLPSLLGREFFRTRVTSYTMRNFEDVVIFVADMERAIAKLSDLEKKLLGMNVLEEYTVPEVARLLGYPQRTVERCLQEALDQLSRILLRCGLMDELPNFTSNAKSCQEGKAFNFDVSDTNEAENKGNNILDKSEGFAYYSLHGQQIQPTKDFARGHLLLFQSEQRSRLYGAVALAGWCGCLSFVWSN